MSVIAARATIFPSSPPPSPSSPVRRSGVVCQRRRRALSSATRRRRLWHFRRRKWFGNDARIRESAFRASFPPAAPLSLSHTHTLLAPLPPPAPASRKRLATEDGAKRLISFSISSAVRRFRVCTRRNAPTPPACLPRHHTTM